MRKKKSAGVLYTSSVSGGGEEVRKYTAPCACRICLITKENVSVQTITLLAAVNSQSRAKKEGFLRRKI